MLIWEAKTFFLSMVNFLLGSVADSGIFAGIFLTEKNSMDFFKTRRIFYQYFELDLLIFSSHLNNN